LKKASKLVVFFLVVSLFSAVHAMPNEAFGTKLLSASTWLGGQGVDVYSNGNNLVSQDYSPPAIGMKWQCVELAQRLYNKLGWHIGYFSNVAMAYQIYDNAGQLGMLQKPNNGSYMPKPGDMIIHSPAQSNLHAGHVSIVDRVEGSIVHVVEQNASATGRAAYVWSNQGLSRPNFASIRGIVHDPDNKLTNTPLPPPPPDAGRPVGNFEYLYYSPGGIRLKGWVADPDAGTAPIDFQVKIDATYFPQQKANLWRPDVNDSPANQKFGDYHGFDVTMPLGQGPHRVCIIALNYGIQLYGQEIGCRDITTNGQAVGNLEEAVAGARVVWLKGWTLDTERSSPIEVHMYVGSAGYAKMADQNRPDVGAAHAQYGSLHGFGYFLPAEPGWRRVCAFGINTGAGTNFEACRDLFISHQVGENAKWTGPGPFQTTYDQYGGEARLGRAVNAVHDFGPSGEAQDFEWGRHGQAIIVRKGINPPAVIEGDHWQYLKTRYGPAVAAEVGYPYNNNHEWGPGGTQDFNGGKLGHVLLMRGSRVGKVFKVFGGIRNEYVNRYGGAPGRLGYPVSDEYPWNGEIHQGFEGGWIQWYGTGARVIWKT
jgi:hypothetical protein